MRLGCFDLRPHGGYSFPSCPARRAPRAGVHVVQAGDTVWRIARQYGVAVKLLVKWNGLDRPDRIFPGERLRVTALPATS